MTAADNTSDRTLAKIRALLAQAEHANTSPAEAEVFTAKATALIAKYGIDEALLAAEQDHREHAESMTIVVTAPFAGPKGALLNVITEALGGRAVRTRRGTSTKVVVDVFGMPSDLVRIEMLYTSLLLQSASALRVADVPYYLSGASIGAWKRSWILGYASAIRGRLQAAEREAQAEAQAHTGASVALVLVDRSTEVHNAVSAVYPRLSTTRTRTSGRGGADGAAAGRRANLGGRTTVGAGSGRALSR